MSPNPNAKPQIECSIQAWEQAFRNYCIPETPGLNQRYHLNQSQQCSCVGIGSNIPSIATPGKTPPQRKISSWPLALECQRLPDRINCQAKAKIWAYLEIEHAIPYIWALIMISGAVVWVRPWCRRLRDTPHQDFVLSYLSWREPGSKNFLVLTLLVVLIKMLCPIQGVSVHASKLEDVHWFSWLRRTIDEVL